MINLIITTREELTEIIQDALSQIISKTERNKSQIETLNLDSVLELLAEHGYQTSKAQIYKFTSKKLIPFMKIGNKLLFSRKEILEWLKNTSVKAKTRDDTLRVIQASLRKRQKE